MAGGRPSAGCCCFFNNVRFLILILTIAAVSTLFSSLILFNITSILHTDLQSDELPVAGLTSLHEYSTWHDRKKREVSEQGNTKFEDDGHPILPSTPATKPVTTTTKPKTKKTEKPRTIFITNSPLPVEVTTTTVPEVIEKPERKTAEIDDVVKNEVEKTLKKLREAEENAKNNNTRKIVDISDDEGLEKPKEPLLSKLKRFLLYAAPGLGVLIGTPLSISIAKTTGIQKLFAMFLALSGLLTITIPFALRLYFVILAIRFFQGLLFSIVFPVMGHVLINWGSLKEQLLFIASMLLFISFGPTFSWPITMILHSNEVPLYIIYILHAIGLFTAALTWMIFYRDRPETHPWVSGVELNKIVAGKVQELRNSRSPTHSYPSILRSISAWSIWTSAFGLFIAVAYFSIYLPSFLCSQDVFFVDYLGIYAALPFILLPIFCLLSSLITKIGDPSTKKVRIFNTLSFVLAALVILASPVMVYLGTENVPLYVLAFTLVPFGLAIVGGFARSLTIVGRVFAQQIVSMTAFSFGAAFVVVPILVNGIVKENKLGEWVSVVMGLVLILLTVAIEFAAFGRGSSASWAENSWDPLVASTKMQSLALIDFNQDECGLYELRRIEPKK